MIDQRGLQSVAAPALALGGRVLQRLHNVVTVLPHHLDQGAAAHLGLPAQEQRGYFLPPASTLHTGTYLYVGVI